MSKQKSSKKVEVAFTGVKIGSNPAQVSIHTKDGREVEITDKRYIPKRVRAFLAETA